jgi:hypothetical protein
MQKIITLVNEIVGKIEMGENSFRFKSAIFNKTIVQMKDS